jgi:hypothetical protein
MRLLQHRQEFFIASAACRSIHHHHKPSPDEPDLKNIFGPPKNYPNIQVTTFIDGKQPPMLLLYGDADTTVEYANLDRLEKRIEAMGGIVHSKIYHEVDHVGLVGALSWFNPHGIPVVQDIVSFFSASVPKSLLSTTVR